jgi:DNA-binding transcriptional ArsR family regulator
MDSTEVLPAARYDIADLCELLAEPARVAMLLMLMDGSARPAGELARAASVSAQTASSHFAKLVAGGVLAVERQGRHRYYRIANDALAHAIEVLGVARARRPPVSGPRPIELARSCYRHLAGRLGVELRRQLEQDQCLTLVGEGYELEPRGIERLAPLLGCGAPAPPGKRCIDWTERHPHIGGALGDVLLSALIEHGWLRRVRDRRVLEITPAGDRGLRSLLGVRVERWSVDAWPCQALAPTG